MDAHSKWIQSHIVSSTPLEATVKVHRTNHGIPEHIEIMEQNDIKHTTISPYHPSSNGILYS